MKIAVIGCGAMGSVYAGRLAVAGHEVIGLGRSAEHIDRIADRGLRVRGPDMDRTVSLQAGTVTPAAHMDLIILAVKAADVGPAAAQALRMIGAHTTVLTIQNGLGSAETVAGVVGAERVAVGIASGFGASLPGPGHVHYNAMRAVRFGPYSSLSETAVERAADAWRSAGFDVQTTSDIAAMQWEKLICNVAYSAPCALTGLTVGAVMDDPELGRVSRSAAIEAWQVAKASGVPITVEDPVAHIRDFGARMPNAKPSALLDHEAQRVSEVDVINGAIPREAAKLGSEAPVNTTLTALIRQRERAWHR